MTAGLLTRGARNATRDRLRLPDRLNGTLTLSPTGAHLVRIEGPIGDVTIDGAQLKDLAALLAEAQERIDWDDGRPTDRVNPATFVLGGGA